MLENLGILKLSASNRYPTQHKSDTVTLNQPIEKPTSMDPSNIIIMPDDIHEPREAAPGNHQPQVAARVNKDELLQEAIAALTLQMHNQNQELPSWKATKNLRVKAFDCSKYDAQTWFEHFSTAVRAQNIADKHVWACFTHNIIDHRALVWASEQLPVTQASLKDIRKAFLEEVTLGAGTGPLPIIHD